MTLADAPLTPLRFEPILKRLIWGGRRLGTVLHKPIGPEDDYAECWEISDHRHGESVVADGPLAGSTLRDLVTQRGAELLGQSRADLDQFPLLVKFIDANRVLSVQVHPNDEQGRRLARDNGKTESWVVIAADPGSLIYAGLKEGVTRPQFAEALKRGEVEPLLHSFSPKPGDCIHVPAGTVHAIGAGVLLAEVQQASDATFRVFDWNRVGPDGQPRALHIDEALEVTDFSRGPIDPVRPQSEPIDGGTRDALVRCPYFTLDRLRITAPTRLGAPDRSRFTIVIGLAGSATVSHNGHTNPISFGQTLLLPAAVGPCSVTPDSPEAVVLACSVPSP